ncbi:DMT family transporter [Leptolyngbya sp. 15MV]|nr:DMT family transporter [Leptolyngbya sp. 15MV]
MSGSTPRLSLGILYMLLAMSVLPVMNGFVQWLSPRYPTEQIVWARIAGQLVVMLALMLPGAGLLVFRTKRPGLQAARSLCQVTSTSFYFSALGSISMAKATAIGFLAPFLVTLLAWPMLGEKPVARRLAVVALAFLGVLVVIRPGLSGFEPAALLVLCSATAYAMYQVLTRKVAPHDPAETSTLWSALLGAVVLTLALPWFWVAPRSLGDGMAFLALGALASAGHYCLARALLHGPAGVIAPFQYWQIVGAVLVGVALTGLWPDAFTWAGSAIVIAAGVILAIMERRR